MLKVFNTTSLSQKQRFWQAVLFGSLASIVLVIIYVFISNLMWEIGVEFSIVYIAFGYAIGYIIQHTGRGVQVKFSILAALLCVFVIFFGDLLTFYPNLLGDLGNFFFYTSNLLAFYLAGASSLIGLAFRIVGIVVAFQTARIV